MREWADGGSEGTSGVAAAESGAEREVRPRRCSARGRGHGVRSASSPRLLNSAAPHPARHVGVSGDEFSRLAAHQRRRGDGKAMSVSDPHPPRMRRCTGFARCGSPGGASSRPGVQRACRSRARARVHARLRHACNFRLTSSASPASTQWPFNGEMITSLRLPIPPYIPRRRSSPAASRLRINARATSSSPGQWTTPCPRRTDTASSIAASRSRVR